MIGADGANSRVRDFLHGSEKGALQPLPLMGASLVTLLPKDVATQIRTKIHDLYFVGIHPEGLVTYCSGESNKLDLTSYSYPKLIRSSQ